ncbi:SLATT domain-containing protein [Pseudomonas sp. WS 5412]|uniref:SLATT domain-containing protein n=1 Tax=Pseudomonas sp. WS 5412 TaxID=2717487 RepID=UPI0014755F8A|nr:SLATT domain-containing protein [Pseudomonas sp. WS 5412]NMY33032.1 SLATT domain-containing protein [Pseudomonas sp. WS 5412]
MDHSLKSLAELELQIRNRLTEFEAKRAKNQKYNRLFSLAQILLTALTTLLIAINTKYTTFPLAVIAIITSSMAAVAGQLLSKFMYQERMAMDIATTCALRELAHCITMDRRKEEDDETNCKITLKQVDAYQGRYQTILNTANGQWQKNIQKSKK